MVERGDPLRIDCVMMCKYSGDASSLHVSIAKILGGSFRRVIPIAYIRSVPRYVSMMFYISLSGHGHGAMSLNISDMSDVFDTSYPYDGEDPLSETIIVSGINSASHTPVACFVKGLKISHYGEARFTFRLESEIVTSKEISVNFINSGGAYEINTPSELLQKIRDNVQGISLSENAMQMLEMSIEEARNQNRSTVHVNHMIIAIRRLLGRSSRLPGVNSLRNASEMMLGIVLINDGVNHIQLSEVVSEVLSKASDLAGDQVTCKDIYLAIQRDRRKFESVLLSYIFQ